MVRFSDVDVFLAVAEAGSFRGAEGRLRISRSTISRAVQRLEQHLGGPLFLRDTRVVRLTDLGRVYLGHARRAHLALVDGERAVASLTEVVEGTLRVSVPLSFGPGLLAPLCASFLEQHPAATIDLQLADEMVNPLEAGVDLAVRVGNRMRDSELLSRSLLLSRLLVVATPALAARFEQGGALPWVEFSRGISRELGESAPVARDVRMTANDYLTVVQAILHGVGAGVVGEMMVVDDLRSGALVRVLPDWSLPEIRIWAVYPAAAIQPPKVRAFIEHLASGLAT